MKIMNGLKTVIIPTQFLFKKIKLNKNKYEKA